MPSTDPLEQFSVSFTFGLESCWISYLLVNLKGKLDVKAFIESVSGPLVRQHRLSANKPFDSSAFIKAFEESHSSLVKLQKTVRRKMDDAEDLALASEKSYHDKISELALEFGTAERGFNDLESSISLVSNSAMLIGEQLEALDKQRIRAQEAKDLVLYFGEFNLQKSARLDAIKNSDGTAGKEKAAGIVKRLFALAKEVDLPVTETARAGIQSYYEVIEKEILQDFDHAYRDGNIEDMARNAKILFDFNGGQSCIQIFVNQHVFFSNHFMTAGGGMPMTKESPTSPLPSNLQEYQRSSDQVDQDLVKLYADIENTLTEEWPVIKNVFPQPAAVMQAFIQRMFAQSVQNLLESILLREERGSIVQYLSALSLSHEATSNLVKSVKSIFDEPVDADDAAQIQQVAMTLNRCQEDLFTLYLDNDKYIDRELKSLNHAQNMALKSFVDFQEARKAAAKNRSMFSKLSSGGAAEDTFVGFRPEAVPSMDIVGEIISIHKHAMHRCRQLTVLSEIPKNSNILFSTLLDFIGKRYTEPCLDMILEELASYDAKLQPDMRFLEVVSSTNLVVHALQQHFQAEVVPLIATQPTIHSQLMVKKNEMMQSFEFKVDHIIQKIMAGIIGWISQILSKQKKFDYRPKETETGLVASLATSPCGQCCDYLKKLHSDLKKYIDGNNRTVVLTELATLFHRFLLDHLKKFVINTSGGLILTKDLVRYQETIAQFQIQALNDRFDALRQLGNLYIVNPENLKNLLEEGLFSRLDSGILHSYIINRADYKQARLDELFEGQSATVSADQQTAWEKTFGEAVGAMGGQFEEFGESLKKILFI